MTDGLLLTDEHRRSRYRLPAFLKTPVLLMFLISSCVALLVLVAYFQVQPVVPLFYTLADPTQQLAAKEWLFLFPALAFAISLLHLWLLFAYRTYTELILKLFAWTSVAILATLSLALVRIVLIIW